MACKTKPYELLNTESQDFPESPEYQKSQDKKKKKVLEDGLSDVEDLLDPEEETRKYAMKLIDAESDSVRTQYLKVVKHMSFYDYAIYTVILPVSKHGTPGKKRQI